MDLYFQVSRSKTIWTRQSPGTWQGLLLNNLKTTVRVNFIYSPCGPSLSHDGSKIEGPSEIIKDPLHEYSRAEFLH